jgi:hypothetical protein
MVEQKHPHRDDDHPRHAGCDHHHGSPPMMIMVVSNISIMAVGGMSVRQRVSASRL